MLAEAVPLSEQGCQKQLPDPVMEVQGSMVNGRHLRGKGEGFGTNCPLALFKGDHQRREQVQNLPVFRVLYFSRTNPRTCTFEKSGRIQTKLLTEITSGKEIA